MVVDTGERTTGPRAGQARTTRWPTAAATALAVEHRPGGRRRRGGRPYGDGRGPSRARTIRRPAPGPTDAAAAAAARAAERAEGRRRRRGWPSSARPTRSTAPPAGWSNCPTHRSSSAPSTRPASWRRTSPGRSSSTTTSTGRPGPNATRDAGRPTSSTSISAKGWVRRRQRRRGPPRGTVASPGRCRTSSPPGRTVGPCAFTEVFEHLGLHRPGSSAIDVDHLLRRLAGDDQESVRTAAAVATAICGVLVTMISLLDPELIIVGGTWGTDQRLLAAVADRLHDQPRRTELRAATSSADAPLAAVRDHARTELRREVLARP